jgi:flagellar biosynthesis/type III secretory pathway protein FliH
MALIRQREADRIAHDAIVLDLGDLRRQGEELVRKAQEQAAQVLESARQERERVVATGYSQGRAKGFADGLIAGKAEGLELGKAEAFEKHAREFAAIDAGWKGALAAFMAQREAIVAAAREDLLRLAIEIARRATTRVIEVEPRAVAGMMDEAIAACGRRTRLVVHVHPEDQAICDAALPGVMARFPECEHAEVRSDAGLARGSVIVRTPAGGEADGSLSVRLDRIAEALVPGAKDSTESEEATRREIADNAGEPGAGRAGATP